MDSTRVIYSERPAWSGDEAWSVDGEPVLVIGPNPANPAAEILAASDAILLEHGRIAIGVVGLDRIRIYGSRGELISSTGGSGSGSGRLRAIGNVFVGPADTIAGVSTRDARIEFFDASGANARSVTLQEPPGLLYLRPLAGFADGAFLARAFAPGPVLPDPGEIIQDTVSLLRHRPDGSPDRRLARLPGTRYLVFDDGGGARQIPIPFSLSPAAAIAGNMLFAGSGEMPEIDAIDPSGRVIRRIRWNSALRPVTDAVRDSLRSLMAGDSFDAGFETVNRFLEAAGLPESLPAWNDLLADDDGILWVGEFTLPWEQGRRWILLDADGRWLGSLTLPATIRPTHITSDRIAGIRDEPGGTQSVVVLELHREAAVSTFVH